MVKYLVGILCSSNVRLLKESFISVLNQIGYDDYEIMIIVNTLNEEFYQDVMYEFGKNNYTKLRKIIRTESNGSPGKGHNSVLKIFYKELRNPDYKITHLSDPYIYLYNGINDDSVTKHHDNNIGIFNHDKNIRDNLLKKYDLTDYKISNINITVYQDKLKENANPGIIDNFYDKTLFSLILIDNQYISH